MGVGFVGGLVMKLNEQDLELIELASQAIKANYDNVNFNHTVSCGVRCASGRVYVGVNVYSLHGACAEQVAIGTAVTNGEREFVSIVAIRGKDGDEILPPCGNCRQMLNDYMPNCEVIISNSGGGKKLQAKELLPFAYAVE